MTTVQAYEHAMPTAWVQYDGTNESEMDYFLNSYSGGTAGVVGHLDSTDVLLVGPKGVPYELYPVHPGEWVAGSDYPFKVVSDQEWQATHTIVM